MHFFVSSPPISILVVVFAILFYLGMYYVLTFCHSSVSTLRSTAINPSFGKNSLIRDGSNLKKLGTSKHLQCFLWGNICSFWYLPIGTYQKQTMGLQMNSLEITLVVKPSLFAKLTESLLSVHGQFLSKITCMKSSLVGFIPDLVIELMFTKEVSISILV